MVNGSPGQIEGLSACVLDPTGMATSTPEAERHTNAQQLIHGYAMWTMAAGMVPAPVIDLGLITAVQLRMLTRLSAVYGVPFAENAAIAIIGVLASSLGAGVLKQTVAGQLIKSVPLVGSILAMMTLPAFAMALTYALGRVFTEHFESGGTFLTFHPEAAKEHFHSEFVRARGQYQPS